MKRGILFRDKALWRIIHRRALRKLEILDATGELADLQTPPSNHFEALKGARKEEYSIRINKQYKICFGFVHGDFYDVSIEDYH